MKKILIIEDDLTLQTIYRDKLTPEYELATATTAQEALTYFVSNKPDLILLDIMLPGAMNGFDLLEEIKRKPDLSQIPVFILTNLETEEKSAREIGAQAYFIKANTTIEEIVNKIHEYTK